MITSFNYNQHTYRFIDLEAVDFDKNIFTIIVGKNGTGKSRLLSRIVNEFIKTSRSKTFNTDRELDFSPFDESKVTYKFAPNKVIAVSTSPFDKFPLIRFKRELEGYSYLGLRELMSHNFGLAYLSKIMSSLIDTLIQKPYQIKEVTTVLNYLGYTDRISIKMQSKIGSRFTRELLTNKDPVKNFEEIIRDHRPISGSVSRKFFYNEDDSVSKKKVLQLLRIIQRIDEEPGLSNEFNWLEIDQNGVHGRYNSKDYLEDFSFLLKSGIIRLQDVTLLKINTNAPFSINEASSGEQSVVIGILGIASQIEDYSLICIDEPEVCLHPEWQERYIKILTSTFGMYKGCHFIIATHSPQIVSNLESYNSFILSMETGEIIRADEVNKHSADFQLANIFNSPGFRNEFLSRIALNTFVKVGKRKVFDSDDLENYQVLKTQSKFLEEGDPVLDLFLALTEMYSLYAGHN
jgi:predicted ATPase